jgi:hypothetical protein
VICGLVKHALVSTSRVLYWAMVMYTVQHVLSFALWVILRQALEVYQHETYWV